LTYLKKFDGCISTTSGHKAPIWAEPCTAGNVLQNIIIPQALPLVRVQKSETRTNKTRMRILREYSESVIVRTYLILELFLLCKEG
jgi:hypothetical protein